MPQALRKANELGVSRLIRSIRQTERGVKIQLYDAHQARVLLGQRLGLWEPKTDKIDLLRFSPLMLRIISADPNEVREAVADLDRIRAERMNPTDASPTHCQATSASR